MSIFSSAQNLFDFSNFSDTVNGRGYTNSLLLAAGAGAALGVSLETAYQVGKGKGGIISGLVSAGTATLSAVPLSYLGFTRGQQILFSAGVPLIGLLIGLLNRKSPDKLVATLSPYVDWASEAGKQVLTIAATASLTLFGVNALATNKPGSWSGSPHLSEVNAALAAATGLNAQTWNNDPTTTVAVQRDGQFTRVVLINPLAVNLTAVSAGAAIVKTGTSDGSTPAAGSASSADPYVGVEVITFANGQVPPELNALSPDGSYVQMMNSQTQTINTAGPAALAKQGQLTHAAAATTAAGDVNGLGILQTAAATSHNAAE